SRALRVTAQGARRFDAWCRPRGRLADAA
ncbi:transcriptional regulator, partial [Bordetella bronchiseptica]